MTYPPFCLVCHGDLTWWNPAQDARCRNCGADIPPVETLTISERRLLDRLLAIEEASRVDVSEDVL